MPPPPAQAAQGWTPPPKPGLIPLRPLTLGPILAASFQVMRRNPRTTIVPALGLAVLTALAAGGGIALLIGSFSRVFTTTSSVDQSAFQAGTFLLALLVAIIGGALILVAAAILQALIVTEVTRGSVGEKQTFGQAWRRIRPRIGAVIGFGLLIILAVVVASLVLFGILTAVTAVFATSAVGSGSGSTAAYGGVIVAVLLGELLVFLGGAVLVGWLGTKLAFVPAGIVIERLGVGAAIARSWRLSRGFFWRTLGILLLVYVMVTVAASIVGFPVQVVAGLGTSLLDPTGATSVDPGAAITTFAIVAVVAYAVQAIVSSLGLVLQSATASLLYVDLRFRKEGLDLDLARYVEQRAAGIAAPDPFLPHTLPQPQAAPAA